MRALIATVLIACSLSIASGEDVFVYDGKEHEWSGMAVSSSMAKAYQQYRERKAISPLWLVHSTGYEARFTVRNGIVYLESISFRFDRGATPEEVMGVAIPPGGLEATWIDSDRIAYFGDPVFEHVRSHERVFEIRKGRLLSVHERESPLAKKLKDMMKKKGEPGATDNPGDAQ
jgi:hypothetical protein